MAPFVYEMVTGKRAFAGESQASLIGAILKDEPGSMAEFETMTPASLDHVIGRCVRKTAADLMHELTWVRDAEPTALEVPGPGARGRWITVALASLATGALVTFLALRSSTPVPTGEVARLTLDVHEGAHLGARADRRPLARAFSISPDGRNLVYVGNDGEGTQLYKRPLDQEPVPIPEPKAPRSRAFLRTDVRSLSFAVQGS